MRGSVYAYMYTYIHTYMHACIHTYIHPYIHTCIHAYRHTHIYTHMHSHIGTFIHSKTTIHQLYIPSTTVPESCKGPYLGTTWRKTRSEVMWAALKSLVLSFCTPNTSFYGKGPLPLCPTALHILITSTPTPNPNLPYITSTIRPSSNQPQTYLANALGLT